MQVDEFWFTGPKSTPNCSESIKTVPEQHNTHPETISELQNEPNCHFQNLDFWIFQRPPLRVASGWHTSCRRPLIKIKIWALWYIDIARFFFRGRKMLGPIHTDSQTATLALYIYRGYPPPHGSPETVIRKERKGKCVEKKKLVKSSAEDCKRRRICEFAYLHSFSPNAVRVCCSSGVEIFTGWNEVILWCDSDVIVIVIVMW